MREVKERVRTPSMEGDIKLVSQAEGAKTQDSDVFFVNTRRRRGSRIAHQRNKLTSMVAGIKKDIARKGMFKVPHMVYKYLQWMKKSPISSHPFKSNTRSRRR